MTFYLHEQDGTNPAFRQRAAAAQPPKVQPPEGQDNHSPQEFYFWRWKKAEHLTI